MPPTKRNLHNRKSKASSSSSKESSHNPKSTGKTTKKLDHDDDVIALEDDDSGEDDEVDMTPLQLQSRKKHLRRSARMNNKVQFYGESKNETHNYSDNDDPGYQPEEDSDVEDIYAREDPGSGSDESYTDDHNAKENDVETWSIYRRNPHENDHNDEDQEPEDEHISQRTKLLFTSDEESSNESETSANGLNDAALEDDMSSEEEEARRHYLRRKKIQESRFAVLNQINEDGRIFLNLAQKEYAAGNHEDAILLIEEAIVSDPRSRLPYILLDVVHSDLGNESAALKAKIAAAIAGSISPDDWADVAVRSVDQGLYDQAVPFYIRAIELDPEEPSYRINLAQVYLKVDQPQRAISTMKRLHKIYPANPTYTSELAKLYLDYDRTEDAVLLYEDILIDNLKAVALDPTKLQPFGWSELNVLCELYDRNRNWMDAISTIKKVSRWLLDRGSEIWWSDIPNDSEFDERRFSVRRFKNSPFSKDPSKYELPLDIRCKLLIFRLEMEDYEEAMIHANFLLEAPVETYPDLFWDAGNRFMKHRKYKTAYELFSALLESTEEPPTEILQATGKCEMELGMWKEAHDHFNHILENDSECVEALVALGEISYALDDVPMAKDYLERLRVVMEARRLRGDQEQPIAEEAPRPSGAFIENVPRPPRKYKKVMSQREREKLKKELRDEMLKEYRELQNEWSLISNNISDVSAINNWKQIAYRMVGRALSMRVFTFGKKMQLFLHTENETGKELEDRLSMLASRIKQNEIDQDVGDDGDDIEYSEEENDGDTEIPDVKGKSRFRNPATATIRGLTVEVWRSIFMWLALVIAAYNDISDSYQVLLAAKGIKLLRGNTGDRILHLVHLSASYLAHDLAGVIEMTRYFLSTHELVYVNDAYRLLFATIGTSVKSVEVFRAQPVQKYYYRRVKLLENHHKTQGKPQSVIPMVILAYSYMINKTFSSALDVLHNAEKIAPRDPLILLSISICNVIRSMSRLSSNRHVQVLQGLSYLMKYIDCRKEEGEAHIKKSIEVEESDKETSSEAVAHGYPVGITLPNKQGVTHITQPANRSNSRDDDKSRSSSPEQENSEEVQSSSTPQKTLDTTNWELQEAYYNAGRVFHSLGLLTEASDWYEKVLEEFPDVVSDESQISSQHESIKENVKVDPEASAYTLKPNTAYNLVQIYSASGNLKLARQLADKYLVI